MNSIISQTLSNVTCGMRFSGKLNIDLNEITSNLVPYPNMHFLIPSISPLDSQANIINVRNTVQLFDDLVSKHNCLIDTDLNHFTQLAASLMIRGDLSLFDAEFYSARIKQKVN